jgi:integrase/recombinase XerD
VIQEISGHNNLEQLQKYLEVKPEQVKGAVAALTMLSHVGESKLIEVDISSNLPAHEDIDSR